MFYTAIGTVPRFIGADINNVRYKKHILHMKVDYESTYLAFLDILGFGHLVRNNSNKELRSIYDYLLMAVHMCLCHGQVRIDSGRAELSSDEVSVNSLIVSDSILLWTDNDNNNSLEELIWVVRMFMDTSFRTGIPTRGAIGIGSLSFRDVTIATPMRNSVRTLFGRVLVDVYDRVSAQEWSGGVLLPNCIERYAEHSHSPDTAKLRLENLKDQEGNRLLIRYPVPYKNGQQVDEWVLQWVRHTSYLPSENQVRDCFAMHNKPVADDRTKRKISNTVAFWQTIRSIDAKC